MNEIDPEVLEAELARLRPARPPEQLVGRLVRLLPARREFVRTQQPASPQPAAWWRLLRLLIPASAAAAVLAIFVLHTPVTPSGSPSSHATPAPSQSALNVDDVEIDHRLITAFDTVARLPSGEPVRFRCREWLDAVVLRDSGRDVSIEQSAPRVEIVPVRFEVY